MLPTKCGLPAKPPVMDEVRRAAERRKVELVVLPTDQAIEILKGEPGNTNAILRLTC